MAAMTSTGIDVAQEDWSFFSVYTTPKLVSMHSKTLRISELVILGFIGLYIICYQMIYKLQFMKAAKADAVISMDLITPQVNFWTCNELHGTCNKSYPKPADFDYCGQEANASCRVYDARAISKYMGRNMFVATRKSYSQQNTCDQAEEDRWKCKSLWVDNGSKAETYFVAGIENYLMKLRHTYSSAALDTDFAASESQGFLKYRNGSVLPIPCYSLSEESKPRQCTYDSASWGSDGSPCGDSKFDGSACFNYGSGNYISLGVLLRAAGVDLDKCREKDGHKLRATGMVLGINFHYTNLDPFDFYTWPVGPVPRYTIEPRFLNLAGNGDDINILIGRKSSDDLGILTNRNQQRHLMTEFGIEIVVSVKGQIGSFDSFHFLVFVSISLSMMQIAKLLVNYVLKRVYFYIQALKPAFMLHDYYEHETTLQEKELELLVEDENLDREEFAVKFNERHKEVTKNKRALVADHASEKVAEARNGMIRSRTTLPPQ